MSLHVIVGAGPVGSTTARLLADRGESVRVLTRRGSGPEHPRIELVAADATDTAVLVRYSTGATALYNCANPRYDRWAVDWPPLAAAALEAARTSGAVLLNVSNLYVYGPVEGEMTEQLPPRSTGTKGRLRAGIWADALAAHRSGVIRTAEIRGSDYLGAGTQGLLTLGVLPRLLSGKRAYVPADLDAPHSWTYAGDVARTLVAAAGDEAAWGQAWHVPTPPPVSIRELAERACSLAGAPAPRMSVMPASVLWLGGVTNPIIRELRETQYQFRKPFVIDSSAATKQFGIDPTTVDTALAETVASLRP